MNDFYIWKYMDFYKFESLVVDKKMFFTFKNYFESASEGKRTTKTLSQKVEELFAIALSSLPLSPSDTSVIINDGTHSIEQLISSSSGNTLIVSDQKIHAKAQLQAIEQNLNKIGISCWTMETEFSETLWSKFVDSSSSGVAIKVKKNKLLSLFDENHIDYKAGAIKYLDFSTESFSPWNEYNFLFHMEKRGYQDEKEFRVLIPMYKNHGMRAYEIMLKNLGETRQRSPLDYEDLYETYKNNSIFQEFHNGRHSKFLELSKQVQREGISVPIDITSCIEEIVCRNIQRKRKIQGILPNFENIFIR